MFRLKALDGHKAVQIHDFLTTLKVKVMKDLSISSQITALVKNAQRTKSKVAEITIDTDGFVFCWLEPINGTHPYFTIYQIMDNSYIRLLQMIEDEKEEKRLRLQRAELQRRMLMDN